MVSFGHAAFIGTGAYTVGILMQQGVMSVWIAWPAAVLVSALFAPAVGAISLRTRGVYFHHDHAGLRADAVLPDGVGEGLGRRDQTRMGAIGFPVYRYQFVAFTLAGALLANQSSFVSPSLLQWNQSGLLLVMVILGGMRHLWSGFIGAVVFLLLEGITRLPMPQRVLRGLARSCQITSIFQRLSVRDNVALAVQARQGSSLRF